MGGTPSKEEVIFNNQQQGANTNVHIALSAVTLGLIVLVLIVITCYFLIKKFRNHVVHRIQENARAPI